MGIDGRRRGRLAGAALALYVHRRRHLTPGRYTLTIVSAAGMVLSRRTVEVG